MCAACIFNSVLLKKGLQQNQQQATENEMKKGHKHYQHLIEINEAEAKRGEQKQPTTKCISMRINSPNTFELSLFFARHSAN